MSHNESYMRGVSQLGAMGGDDLLQFEKQPLPESSKVPGHGGSGVQLQAQHNLSNHLNGMIAFCISQHNLSNHCNAMIACCIYQQTCMFSAAQ